MKKYCPKKINFTLAAFAVCFMLFLLAPSTSSLGGHPMMGSEVFAFYDGSTYVSNVSYTVYNGKGTLAIGAYFKPGTFDSADKGRHKISAFVDFRTGVEYSANLIIYGNGAGWMVGVVTGS
jgi:hypothetical protein